MTSFSASEWSNKPIPLRHIPCNTTWDLYCAEWPPKIVICPQCHAVLALRSQDPVTKKTSYRLL